MTATEPTVAEMALAVADAMEDESAWTQHAYARDRYGEPVSESAASACRWCASGRVRVLYPLHYVRLLHAYAERNGHQLCESNDCEGRIATIDRLRQLAREGAT